MPNLIVERGREKGTTFELKADAPCVAGRDPETVQIVLSDPASSRRHFQVAGRGGKWYVTDLGSKNHTFLNEERLEKERELASGDRIQVGETVLSFNEDDKADKAASTGMAGKEIGGYKILDRLGRGGMGTVYKARQISLNRVIALKMLSAKFSKDPKFVTKFVSEARAAGQLNHPNVVQVFDVGELGGIHFFSMELMEGGCVQDLLSAAPEGRLTWQAAMPLILDAARGLVFAEKRGIIHRDIKPDNLMLTSEQRVKIGDLGLAMKAEEGPGEKAIFGTPHFIAPEQAQGKEVTHAADLYALGGTYYRMVTGKTPFSGDTVKEILKKQINDPHQPIHEIVPDFPPDLEAIVDKLMAKKVENRYQSATKLVEDLEAFQLEHQIELSGARKKNRPLLIGLTLVGLAAAGVAIYYATRPPQIKTVKGDKEVITIKEPGGPGMTDAEKRAIIATKAKDAYYAVKDKDPREISLDKKADLLKLAAEYEALSSGHSDPAAAEVIKPGLDRAKDIRETLQRLEDEKAATETAARDWLSKSKGRIDDLEKRKHWDEAIRTAEGWLKGPDLTKHSPVVPEAKDWLAKIPARELELAESDFEVTRAKADEKAATGDMQGAIQHMQDWISALSAQNPQHEKLKSLIEDAKLWLDTKRGDYQNALLASLDVDRITYVEALRTLRTGAAAGSIYAFKFDAAESHLKSALGALKTWIYQDKGERHLARLRAAHAGFTGFVQLLADGKIAAHGEELKGLPVATSGVTYKMNLEEKPNPDHFTVDTKIGAATAKKSIDWSEFSREDIASVFILPKADRIPADVALGLAWMFVELGNGSAAQTLLERATSNGVKPAPEDEAALRREINAIAGYEELRKKAGADPTELVQAVQAWRLAAKGSDTYVLVDGRAAGDLEILTQEEFDTYIRNLGIRPK